MVLGCALAAGCAAKRTPEVLLGEHPLPPMRITTKSELVLTCDPPDAEVSLDGVPQGTCEDFRGEPKGLFLGTGVRRVQVKKRGFLPWDTIVETDGTRVMMTVTLIASASSAAPGGSP